jgi:hypothetical protein
MRATFLALLAIALAVVLAGCSNRGAGTSTAERDLYRRFLDSYDAADFAATYLLTAEIGGEMRDFDVIISKSGSSVRIDALPQSGDRSSGGITTAVVSGSVVAMCSGNAFGSALEASALCYDFADYFSGWLVDGEALSGAKISGTTDEEIGGTPSTCFDIVLESREREQVCFAMDGALTRSNGVLAETTTGVALTRISTRGVNLGHLDKGDTFTLEMVSRLPQPTQETFALPRVLPLPGLIHD